jgi:VCBS repeat-containing protein
MNLSTGAPTSISAANMLYNSGVPDIVGAFANGIGQASWGTIKTATNQLNGSYFDPSIFVRVPDPQCSSIQTNLRTACTLTAIAQVVPAGTPGSFVLTDGTNRSAQYVLQNPLPGTRGNLGQFTMQNPGTWRFDANMSKTFRVGENKNVQVRIDTTNVLNHPSPMNPNLNINTTTSAFGEITSKAGNRSFQGQVRLSF